MRRLRLTTNVETNVRVFTLLISAGVLAGSITSVVAQEVASVGAVRPEQMRMRFQVAAMEGVLERAVQLGARRLSEQVQAVSPDSLFIAGAARAKGFRLDGYGVFFDVDVPAMRRSLVWSFRTLDRQDRGLEVAMQSLKRHLETVRDPRQRREMEEAFQRIARSVGPVGPATASSAVATSSEAPVVAADAAAPAPGSTASPAVLDDPGLAYTNEVKAALTDAMLEYGTPLPIAEDEWLTVAARDDHDSRISGGDPYDVSTIILRIRGADLAAYRAQRLTREEALTKVEVREY